MIRLYHITTVKRGKGMSKDKNVPKKQAPTNKVAAFFAEFAGYKKNYVLALMLLPNVA